MSRSSILACGLVTGSLLLSLAACTATPPPNEEKPVPACPQTRNWAAWVDAMPGPGKEPRLIVEGEVDLPAGRTATLVPGPTDRMSPPGQRFALELSPGAGAGGWQKVRGELKPSLIAYHAVIVGCAGETLARIEDVPTTY